MSTPLWVHYKNDLCFGDSDANGNVDTYNRASKGVWGNFSAFTGAEGFGSGTGEHDRDGAHMSDLVSALWTPEEGTYTGNGNDNEDIFLADSGLDIKFLRIWDGSVAYTFFTSEDVTADNTKDTSNTIFVADYIQSVATTGQFQVGKQLNVNLRNYYYIAYGVS
jgi:hypothetical protein